MAASEEKMEDEMMDALFDALDDEKPQNEAGEDFYTVTNYGDAEFSFKDILEKGKQLIGKGEKEEEAEPEPEPIRFDFKTIISDIFSGRAFNKEYILNMILYGILQQPQPGKRDKLFDKLAGKILGGGSKEGTLMRALMNRFRSDPGDEGSKGVLNSALKLLQSQQATAGSMEQEQYVAQLAQKLQSDPGDPNLPDEIENALQNSEKPPLDDKGVPTLSYSVGGYFD